ncbi:hypothetical protein [Shewanella xiamenensis]|uniref:hypothetical protein n=1 Tax=Shewanella xiamenensis TaxID=332186 RepID=UPI00244C2D24|nr:hypothetical protein [Shewanella xiamenensis]MDH1624839.1 hypothetical protein [Shewanella xiamenensis]MDV5247269.1 hypothetical protein [Shewanella xiamenensis]
MALSTAAEIEAFADKLTEVASEAHAKVVAQAKNKVVSLEKAQNAFEQIQLLRQEAQGLYIDAVVRVISSLELAQKDLLDDIDRAKEHIGKIDQIAEVLSIVTKLIELVAKVQTADIKGVVSVTKELKTQLLA